MSSTCDLCGALEDERALQVWRDGWLCRSCDGLYSDEELMERNWIVENTREENEAYEKANN